MPKFGPTCAWLGIPVKNSNLKVAKFRLEKGWCGLGFGFPQDYQLLQVGGNSKLHINFKIAPPYRGSNYLYRGVEYEKL